MSCQYRMTMEVVMQEFENVRNEIPTYVIDRLENEWRLVQAQGAQAEAGVSSEAATKTAPVASDKLASLDK
ncbi:MAG: hypothetical protein BGP09_14035 [Rhizobium sp. 60-20]|nr:MAG: hypothetical protein BGP09_14035 [Rhizobium sp. 60-20]